MIALALSSSCGRDSLLCPPAFFLFGCSCFGPVIFPIGGLDPFGLSLILRSGLVCEIFLHYVSY